MDIVTLLENDHRHVEQLFERYRSGEHGVVSELMTDLEIHTALEEEIVYPVIRTAVPGGEDMVSHAKDEHRQVDMLLMNLSQFPDDVEGAEELIAAVNGHVSEEENEVFSAMKQALHPERLEELGAEAETFKREHG